MARSIWRGAIGFGLVSVPVRLVTAVRDQSIRFNMLAPDGSCRLRQKLYCPETGKEYDFKEAARGYEIAPDQYVLINDDELERLRPESGRSIEILRFVDLVEIDPVHYQRTYYLLPDDSGAKPYHLLAAAMSKSGKAALARFVMRDREHLAALRVREKAMVLHTMHYADEIVPISSLEELRHEPIAPERELKVAEQLINALSGHFDPTEFRDEFRSKLEKAIEAKAEGEKIVTAASEPSDVPPVYNLMEALKRSLEETAQSRKPKPTPERRRRKSA